MSRERKAFVQSDQEEKQQQNLLVMILDFENKLKKAIPNWRSVFESNSNLYQRIDGIIGIRSQLELNPGKYSSKQLKSWEDLLQINPVNLSALLTEATNSLDWEKGKKEKKEFKNELLEDVEEVKITNPTDSKRRGHVKSTPTVERELASTETKDVKNQGPVLVDATTTEVKSASQVVSANINTADYIVDFVKSSIAKDGNISPDNYQLQVEKKGVGLSITITPKTTKGSNAKASLGKFLTGASDNSSELGDFLVSGQANLFQKNPPNASMENYSNLILTINDVNQFRQEQLASIEAMIRKENDFLERERKSPGSGIKYLLDIELSARNRISVKSEDKGNTVSIKIKTSFNKYYFETQKDGTEKKINKRGFPAGNWEQIINRTSISVNEIIVPFLKSGKMTSEPFDAKKTQHTKDQNVHHWEATVTDRDALIKAREAFINQLTQHVKFLSSLVTVQPAVESKASLRSTADLDRRLGEHASQDLSLDSKDRKDVKETKEAKEKKSHFNLAEYNIGPSGGFMECTRRKEFGGKVTEGDWKAHLSVLPGQLDKAIELITPILNKYKVSKFKYSNLEILADFKKQFDTNIQELEMKISDNSSDSKDAKQQLANERIGLAGTNRVLEGMQLTIYIPKGEEVQYNIMLAEIENVLAQNNITKGNMDSKTDEPIGSYASIRYEGAGSEDSTKVSEYKPKDVMNPFQNVSTINEQFIAKFKALQEGMLEIKDKISEKRGFWNFKSPTKDRIELEKNVIRLANNTFDPKNPIKSYNDLKNQLLAERAQYKLKASSHKYRVIDDIINNAENPKVLVKETKEQQQRSPRRK